MFFSQTQQIKLIYTPLERQFYKEQIYIGFVRKLDFSLE